MRSIIQRVTLLKRRVSSIPKIGLLLVLAYLAICLFLFVVQRRLIYLPSRERQVLPAGFEVWMGTNAGGGAELWGFKRVKGAAECLLFFHGNGGNASGWSHAVADFPGDVFVLEYPGYGERSGHPSERSIKDAALQAFKAEPSHYTKVVVCGQSLGTAVTEVIFTEHASKIHALVLVTPFLSLAEVAGAHFSWLPARRLLHDRLALYESYLKFPGRSLVVIAADDEVIPRAHGLRYLGSTNEIRRAIELPSMTHNSIILEEDFWTNVLQHEHWK